MTHVTLLCFNPHSLATVAKYTDFVDLATEGVFYVSRNTSMKVKIQKKTQAQLLDISATMRRDCDTLFQHSGLLTRVGRVNWDMLHMSTYNMLHTVSNVYTT